MEAAQCIVKNPVTEQAQLKKVSTPGVKTIEDLCAFLHLEPEQTCKAVVYQKNEDDGYVVVFIRGDLEVNETKLRNLLKTEIHPAFHVSQSRPPLSLPTNRLPQRLPALSLFMVSVHSLILLSSSQLM